MVVSKLESLIFFTYVLLEDQLQFSATGEGFLTDFSSKHAMHSNCSESVYYAGEFHIQPVQYSDTIQYKVVLDNNSGTYAPSEELLPELAEVFRQNFAGLQVEVMAYDDPKLHTYKQRLKDNFTVNVEDL